MTEPVTAMRTWCETFARNLTLERIQPEGKPYLDRYFVVGWHPGTKELVPDRMVAEKGMTISADELLASLTVLRDKWQRRADDWRDDTYDKVADALEACVNDLDALIHDYRVLAKERR